MTDLIAASKAKNGELTYGSWNVGSPDHRGAALLEGATGTQMRHIPFKETSRRDVQGRQTQIHRGCRAQEDSRLCKHTHDGRGGRVGAALPVLALTP